MTTYINASRYLRLMFSRFLSTENHFKHLFEKACQAVAIPNQKPVENQLQFHK